MNLISKKKIDASHINIKLKPIFGIKPEKYIPIIYIVFLSVLFFLLIIFPGIIKNGSVVTITSSPPGSSVWVDGKRVGSTPLKTFINKGNKAFEIKRDGFETEISKIDIKGRVLFSLFFKMKQDLHFNLRSNNGNKILQTAYNDMANWSLMPDSEIDERSRIPNFISTAITDYSYSSDFNKDLAKDYLYSSIKTISHRYMLSDYLRAFITLNSENKMTTMSSLKKSLIDFAEIRNKSKNFEILLYSKLLNGIDIYIERYQKLRSESKRILDNTVISYESSMDDLKVSNYNFIYIPKGSITPLEKTNFIHQILEDSFYISNKMVVKDDFFKFIADTPKWNRDNLNNLVEENLVDEGYLQFMAQEEYITNISYHAAVEWIEWANKNLDIPDGYKLSLPTENQWLSAIIYGTLGDIEAWHWTSQGYYTYDHFLADDNGQFIEEFDFVEPRLVVGSNKYSNMGGNPRGVQKANWCTPFLGFRPVLIKE